jgi:hypothetical protein
MTALHDARTVARGVRRAWAWTRRHSLLVLGIVGVLTELAAHLWPILLAAGGVVVLVRLAGRRGRAGSGQRRTTRR